MTKADLIYIESLLRDLVAICFVVSILSLGHREGNCRLYPILGNRIAITQILFNQYISLTLQVIFRLRKKGNSKGPDYDRFHRLADSVEEFIYHLLDPMRPETKKKDREQFGEFILDYIMGDAFDCHQKKVEKEFDHPCKKHPSIHPFFLLFMAVALTL